MLWQRQANTYKTFTTMLNALIGTMQKFASRAVL